MIVNVWATYSEAAVALESTAEPSSMPGSHPVTINLINNFIGGKMNIDELTLGQIKQLKSILINPVAETFSDHPMFGKRCLIRTYSAGVHIGDVAWINPNNSMEIKIENALRLWKWEGGGLSLSSVANNGIKGGRLNKTGEVFLTNVIEFIPTTTIAEKSYVKFIED